MTGASGSGAAREWATPEAAPSAWTVRAGRCWWPSTTAAAVPTAPGVDPNDVWPFAGTVGVATTPLKPGGSAEFPYADDRRKTAVVSDSGYVEAGTKLAVIEARGNRVVVRPIGRVRDA